MYKRYGFTVVELIVVCIALGILASLSLMWFGGARTASQDRLQSTEVNEWAQRFNTYRNRYMVYPSMTNGDYCLGTGFPSGKCKYVTGGTAVAESGNTAILTELQKVGTLPSYTHNTVKGTMAGPWANFTSTYIRIYGAFNNSCPTGTTQDATYTAARVCYIQLNV